MHAITIIDEYMGKQILLLVTWNDLKSHFSNVIESLSWKYRSLVTEKEQSSPLLEGRSCSVKSLRQSARLSTLWAVLLRNVWINIRQISASVMH